MGHVALAPRRAASVARVFTGCQVSGPVGRSPLQIPRRRHRRTRRACDQSFTNLSPLSSASGSILRETKKPPQFSVAFSPSHTMSTSSSTTDGPQLETYLSNILQLVQKEKLIAGQLPRSSQVCNFKQPADVAEALPLAFSRRPATTAELDSACQAVVSHSVKTMHQYFYNQLYHGVDEYSVAGAWLTEALNTNAHTFECAPAFLVVERHVLQYIRGKFGWSKGDGIFSPGGALSNMYGMVLARHRKFPDLRKTGMFGGPGRLVAFTSEECHYSIKKNAIWMGLGTDNVVAVKSDAYGRMRADALERAVLDAKAQGGVPFFVNATAGTTVMGAFDPLDELAGVCEAHGLWLHVDACWGGAAIMSDKHKHLLHGCQRVDSISWNWHKMLGSSCLTSPFVTRHENSLVECNTLRVDYLFQGDKCYDPSYDTGDKSVQCGRKPDAFKLWFLLKARGEDHMAGIVDNAVDQARYLHKLVQTTPGFRPAFDFEPEYANVCFHYVPERLRGQEETDAWWAELSTVPPKIKEAMMRKGSLLVGYQPMAHRGIGNMFRMVVHGSPASTKEDMEYVIQEINRLGKDL